MITNGYMLPCQGTGCEGKDWLRLEGGAAGCSGIPTCGCLLLARVAAAGWRGTSAGGCPPLARAAAAGCGRSHSGNKGVSIWHSSSSSAASIPESADKPWLLPTHGPLALPNEGTCKGAVDGPLSSASQSSWLVGSGQAALALAGAGAAACWLPLAAAPRIMGSRGLASESGDAGP